MIDLIAKLVAKAEFVAMDKIDIELYAGAAPDTVICNGETSTILYTPSDESYEIHLYDADGTWRCWRLALEQLV